MANWAQDLARGFGQGAIIGDSIKERTKERKKDKVAALVAKEQDDKLFNVEDKGAIGNWLYDTLGIGDPPQKTPKAGPPPASPAGTAAGIPGAAAPQANAAAQAAPMSDVRERVASGLNLAQAAGESGAPAELIPLAETEMTPVRNVGFAAATPLVANPAAPMSPTAGPPALSALQQALLAAGIKPNGGARA